MKLIQLKQVLTIILIIFSVLYGCTPRLIQTPAVNQETTPSPTTVMHTATPTHHPTKTPTMIPTHTLLTTEEIRAWFMENMITPECHLPCWLGITPGKSTWDKTKERLVPYVHYIDEREVDPNGHFTVTIFFDISTKETPATSIYLGVSIQDNVVTSMSMSGFEEFGYKLPELLSILGEPGQVWVWGYFDQYMYSGPRDIFLDLYYPDENLIASFAAHPTEPIWTDASDWQNCLAYGSGIQILEKDENRSFDEVAVSLGSPQYPVLPVSEALEMSVQTFYEMYKDATDPICFKTQVELWLWELEEVTPNP